MNLEKQSYKSNFKPKAKSKPVRKNYQSTADRQILDTLYSHYGKPQNIVKEDQLFQSIARQQGGNAPTGSGVSISWVV